jgi:hypothetical protein
VCEAIDWEGVKWTAEDIFNVWVSGGDLAWAKEVWGHLGVAGLTQADNILDRARVFLRLIMLGKIYEEFAFAKWDENPDRSFAELSEKADIDRLALGLLAGSAMPTDEWPEDDYELYEASLEAAAEPFRSELFSCLSRAYGGIPSLYERMSATAKGPQEEGGQSGVNQDEDEREDGEISDQGEEFEITDNNIAAYGFVENGFNH